MKIVVIGLGSMGKRRIRLIRELYPGAVLYGVDGRADRREEAWQKFHIECQASIPHVPGGVGYAFVCTPPLSHAAIIQECLARRWHVFTELNLVPDGYEENMRLAAANRCQLFLSSTFLYREEVRYIMSKVRSGGKWNYIYHIGQYLPDWHPWESYRDFFVSDRRSSGCREIFAVELPWLVQAFGEIGQTHVWPAKLSGLEVSYPDSYMLQAAHVNGCQGVLAVDVVSPYAARRFEAYTDGGYITWEGTPGSLAEYDAGSGALVPVQLYEKAGHCEGYADFIVEDAYREEIRAFFKAVEEGRGPGYGFEQDKKVLHLIDTIGV